MGVNRIGFGIIDDNLVRNASKQEVIRRFLRLQCDFTDGMVDRDTMNRAEALMRKLELKTEDRIPVEAARQAAQTAKDAGKGKAGGNIVSGIWEGIKGMADWLWGKVKGFFEGIVNGVKDTLGIASPSKVFAGIGDNMAAGIGVGFDRTMASVERDMIDAMPDLGNFQTSFSMSNASKPISGQTINYGGVAINVNGAGRNADQIARELQLILNRKVATFA